jgi:hypothetical protein
MPRLWLEGADTLALAERPAQPWRTGFPGRAHPAGLSLAGLSRPARSAEDRRARATARGAPLSDRRCAGLCGRCGGARCPGAGGGRDHSDAAGRRGHRAAVSRRGTRGPPLDVPSTGDGSRRRLSDPARPRVGSVTWRSARQAPWIERVEQRGEPAESFRDACAGHLPRV